MQSLELSLEKWETCSRYAFSISRRSLELLIRIHISFQVDIGSADVAFLSYLAFEGATKRNRPTLKTGDLIYARVISTSKHVEPELS